MTQGGGVGGLVPRQTAAGERADIKQSLNDDDDDGNCGDDDDDNDDNDDDRGGGGGWLTAGERAARY